jgi:hypothetical protein
MKDLIVLFMVQFFSQQILVLRMDKPNIVYEHH